MDVIPILANILDLGTAGVVLIILWFYRKDSQSQIREREIQIVESYNTLIHMTRQITEVTSGVQSALENNTNALENLLEKFDYITKRINE